MTNEELDEGEGLSSDHEYRHGHRHESSIQLFGEKTELIFALLCGVFLVTGWVISYWSVPAWGPISLFCGAYFFGGAFALLESWEKLLQRQLEIDLLMIVAALGAAVLGHWAEGAFLLFLFSISHSLEHYAMGRARRAIESLSELAPDTAIVRRNGETEEVDVSDLLVGDVVVVKPNERIAADGFVIKGTSSVDQSPITGESVPVDKNPVTNVESAARNHLTLPSENRIFAGTINQNGALDVMVTKLATESTLARVVKLVNDSQSHQSGSQRFAERFERVFVPSVLAGVGLLLFAWTVIDEPVQASFYRAMAVLVGASPCALAISTPSAVLSGVARAARGGVLIKGGGPLEELGKVSAIAFDKTGTLTEGRPQLTDVLASDTSSEFELLAIAIAVEAESDHPLATAIVRDGKERLMESQEYKEWSSSVDNDAIPAVENLTSITGRGVKGNINGQQVYIGKIDLFLELDGAGVPRCIVEANEGLVNLGRTTMVVRLEDRYLGVLGMMDTPRESAKQTVSQLKKLGIDRMLMISGDNQIVANAVAKSVGLDEALGDLMPEQKVESIRKIRETMGVAMVGDGVNDAPAMANANVGIAMGAAGSDVALETAEIALMADNLTLLPFSIGLSRMANQIIRQNVWISLGMVAFLVPAAIFGLKMGPAVVLHEGSTLVVVLNALRLLAFKN